MSDGMTQKTTSDWGGYFPELTAASEEPHTIHIPASWSGPATAPLSSPKISALLDEREKTHGDFADVARVANDILNAISRGPNDGKLSPVQAEALKMIASKLGRIMSGDPNEADHWRDISGYAQLVADRL